MVAGIPLDVLVKRGSTVQR